MKSYKKISVWPIIAAMIGSVYFNACVYAQELNEELPSQVNEEAEVKGWELAGEADIPAVRQANPEEVSSVEGSVEDAMEDLEGRPALGWSEKENDCSGKEDKAGAVGDNINWQLQNGVLTLSGSGDMENYETSMPGWQAEGFASSEDITSVVIEEGITSIGESAFLDCRELREVSIPSTVSSIGEYAFTQCSSLTEVEIPDAVTMLTYAVFGGCTSLAQIHFEQVTDIDDYVFQNTKIEEFPIPSSLASISWLAFYDADIKSFRAIGENSVYTVEDGILYTDRGKTLAAYPAGRGEDSFSIPSHVTKIGDMAMGYTENLASVTIGDSVQELGASAFQNSGITSVVIPDSVTAVGDFTFFHCPWLERVTFGKGLIETSYQMFRECDALRQIDFGDGLQNLHAHTFAYCGSLLEVELPASVRMMGVGCFGECHNLLSFRSAAIDSIPYSGFWNCFELQEVVLNEGVKDIARSAFHGCVSLMEVTLPYSVDYVHSSAFLKNTVITCLNPELEPYGENGYRYIQKIDITGERDYDQAFQVLSLVNAERAQNGLEALTMDGSLLETAMARAAECAVCFSHTRPDGSICFDMDSAMIAENVAAGQQNAQNAMDSWMSSEGHKENILQAGAKDIGIGCFKHNGNTYWVQCFGTIEDTKDCEKLENQTLTQTISLAAEEFGEAATGSGIIWGEVKIYSYDFRINLPKTRLRLGEDTSARVYLVNPGFPSASALPDNMGITWKSSNDVITVEPEGRITGKKEGSTTVTAQLKYYSTSKSMNVYAAKEVILSSKSYIYNGKVRKPSVTVKGEDGKVIDPSYYRITYPKGCKKVGRYTVTITFSGRYRGKAAKNFTIIPKSTQITRAKAGKKQITVKWKKHSVENTGYQIQYSTRSNLKKGTTGTRTVRNKKTGSVIIKKLKSGRKYYVRVRTYKQVRIGGKSKKIYSEWSKVRKVQVK